MEIRHGALSTWKYQFSYDHSSLATLSSLNTYIARRSCAGRFGLCFLEAYSLFLCSFILNSRFYSGFSISFSIFVLLWSTCQPTFTHNIFLSLFSSNLLGSTNRWPRPWPRPTKPLPRLLPSRSVLLLPPRLIHKSHMWIACVHPN